MAQVSFGLLKHVKVKRFKMRRTALYTSLGHHLGNNFAGQRQRNWVPVHKMARKTVFRLVNKAQYLPRITSKCPGGKQG